MFQNSLYISYFGLREPLVQTQVLPYLRELHKDGWLIYLITFEKGGPQSYSADELESWRKKLKSDGIIWQANSYTDSRKIWAKVKDILRGFKHARLIIKEHQIQIIHGRAHVGTTIGLISGMFLGTKLLFDIRGFNPEEQVESGRWSALSLKFYGYKFVEKILLWRASAFVLLTDAGRKTIFPKSTPSLDNQIGMYFLPDGRPIQIIPCCVDDSRFEMKSITDETKKNIKNQIGLGHCARLIAHVGALGGLYPEERIVATFKAIYSKYPDTGFVILSQTSPDLLKEMYEQAGLPNENLWIGSVSSYQVADYLSICDWGLSIKKESYSQLSCSPTKIPEYLLVGLPILCSRGIGDCDSMIAGKNVGIVFDAWDDQEIRKAVERMEDFERNTEIKLYCRQMAIQFFDLKTIGGPRYRAIYSQMISSDSKSMQSRSFKHIEQMK